MSAATVLRGYKDMAKAEAKRATAAQAEAAEAERAAAEAERQVRSLVLDRDRWKRRAEDAEAKLASMGCAR